MENRKYKCDLCKVPLNFKEFTKSLDNKNVVETNNGKCNKCGISSKEAIVRILKKEEATNLTEDKNLIKSH